MSSHADLEDNRSGSVKLTTSNGGVELKLGAVTPGEVTAATSNGSITVRIPASAGARVKAGTSGNSRVASDLNQVNPIKSLDYALIPQYSFCVVFGLHAFETGQFPLAPYSLLRKARSLLARRIR